LFPRNYAGLLNTLLEILQETDGRDKIKELLSARMERLYDSYAPQIDGKSLEERIEQLAKLQESQGYMPEIKAENGSWLFVEHNCPIARIANSYPEACIYELELISRLLQAKVERPECIALGGNSCAYRVSKLNQY
jgi:predicted ArsR family transcriptional regulator